MLEFFTINSDRVHESHFPKITIQSNSVLLRCFPDSLSKENINKTLIDYDVRQSYLYKNGNDYGVAFLRKSDSEKSIREVKEVCIDESGNIAKDGKVAIGRTRRSDAKYCKCSDEGKESLSGKELMKGLHFTPLPCPFGLHLIYEKPNAIIRVLDNEVLALAAAACDRSSVYLSANEEQLSGELARDKFVARTIVYYPKYENYKKALDMKADLAKQGLIINVSSFMEDVSFVGKNNSSDITDYIRLGLGSGKSVVELMKSIFMAESDLESSGGGLW